MGTNRLQRTSPDRFLAKSSPPWQQSQSVLGLRSRENRISACSFFILEPSCIVNLRRMNLFAASLAFSSFSNDRFASSQSNTFLSQLQPWPSFHLLRLPIPLLSLLFHLNASPVYGLYRDPIYNKAILFAFPQALRTPKPGHFCSRVRSRSSSVMPSLFLHSFWLAAGFEVAWLQNNKWHRDRAGISAGC